MIRALLGRVPVRIFLGVNLYLFLVFATIRLLPGDPTHLVVGTDGAMLSDAAVAERRHQLGLDQSIGTQYLRWIASALTGDLGRSTRTDEPVTLVVVMSVGRTGILVLIAWMLSTAIAVALGSIGTKPYLKAPVSAIAASLLSIPSFAWGLVLLYVASGIEGFPLFARRPAFLDLDATIAMLLPCLALATNLCGVLTLITRDRVETFRASLLHLGLESRGVPSRRQLIVHIFPYLLHAQLRYSLVWIRSAFLGAVLVEQLFAWPGIGRLLVSAISSRDYSLVQGIALAMLVLVFAIVNLEAAYYRRVADIELPIR